MTAEAIVFAVTHGWALVEAGRSICLTEAGLRPSRGRIRCPGWHLVQLATGPAERVNQLLQPSGGAMDEFASFDFFDLDDTAFPLAYSVDRMHANAATTNEPRHH
jgi:hypothetical protein